MADCNPSLADKRDTGKSDAGIRTAEIKIGENAGLPSVPHFHQQHK